MTTTAGYGRKRESGNTVLQTHMESTAQAARFIEMRRRTIYSAYSAPARPPSLDLALGTLAATLARAVSGHTADMVAIARQSGATWSQIGEALGVSKQAAHEHFRKPSATTGPQAVLG